MSAQTPGGVVIRERVEIRSPAAAPRQPPVAGRGAGGARGHGTFRLSFGSAELLRQPLETLSVRVTTTNGQSASVSIGSAGTLYDQRDQLCTPNATPGDYDDAWEPCTLRKYTRYDTSAVLTFHLDADEDPDSLVVTGPGVDLRYPISIPEPSTSVAGLALRFGCGWTYAFENGGISNSNCDCIAAAPDGDVHGAMSLQWSFVPDPAEALAVTVAPDSLVYQADGSPFQTGAVQVQAVYADGTPAPYPGGDLTYSVPASPFGSLVSTWCYYSCSEQGRGTTQTGGYQSGLSVAYRADGIGGGAAVPPAHGPEADVPLTLTVTGGGLSGTAPLVLLGRLRLELDADPDSIATGGQSALTAVLRGAGAAAFDPDATLTFSLDSPSMGTLRRTSTDSTGTTLTGIPRAEAAAGGVTFVAVARQMPPVLARGGMARGDSTAADSVRAAAYIHAFVESQPALADTATVMVAGRSGLHVSLECDASGACVVALDGFPDLSACGRTYPDLVLTVRGVEGHFTIDGQRVDGGTVTVPFEAVTGRRVRFVVDSSCQPGAAQMQVGFEAPVFDCDGEPILLGDVTFPATVIGPESLRCRLNLVAVPDTVRAGEEVRFTITSPGLDPATPVTLSLLDLTLGWFELGAPAARGADAASTSGQRLSAVTSTLGSVGEIVFRATDEAPPEISAVTVTARASGRVGAAAITVLAAPSLTLNIDRDTLLVTDVARVTVAGVTDPNALITLAASSPHGRLIRVVGADTTALSGQLPLSEIASSRILFAADGTWPEAEAAVQIQATTSGGEVATAALIILPPRIRYDLNEDSTTYIPSRGDDITVMARLENVPDNFRGRIRFSLDTHFDFTFADSTTTARELSLISGTAEIHLRSVSWWGVAVLRGSVEGHAPNLTLSRVVHLPIDIDNDTIADVWEKDSTNGGTLSLGGTSADGSWNEETSPGNSNDGDAFTKLAEYQGVLIGGVHRRLLPTAKEVFFDVRQAAAGTFAISEVQRQLGLTVYEIDGLRTPGGTSTAIPPPGVNALRYISPTTFSFGARGVVFVVDLATGPSPDTGIMVQAGIWASTGSTVIPNTSPQFNLGNTRSISSMHSGAISNTFTDTIHNIWTNNSLPETASLAFPVRVAEVSSDVDWFALYNGTDLNGVNGTADFLNPYDIATVNPLPNDPLDFIVATRSEAQTIQFTTLHEVGHALGMSPSTLAVPGGIHPATGTSVMRSGYGPAKNGIFSAFDIQEMSLK